MISNTVEMPGIMTVNNIEAKGERIWQIWME